jgi:hypothetical protein
VPLFQERTINLAALMSQPGPTTGSVRADFTMKKNLALLRAILSCTGTSLAQLGVNCGEHSKIFHNQFGIVSFTPEQLEKRMVRRIEPVTPRSGVPFHYDTYITFKILVATNGDIGCIWEPKGEAVFRRAVNEALQYWRYQPMLVDGKPIEYVGVVKVHLKSD